MSDSNPAGVPRNAASALAPISVGVLTASISREAGGLFWSVRSLAAGVKRSGCQIKVFSIVDRHSKGDAGHWSGLGLEMHNRLGPKAFGYAPGLGAALHGSGLDLVHTHGLWMYPSVAAARWAARCKKPLVVSPRGMLDHWAVRNSAVKKRIAGWLYEHRHLRRAACLHALNDAEYRAIRAYGLANPVAVIPNGVDLPASDSIPAPPEWAAGLGDAPVLLFLGRLHPKKGLPAMLHAWARVQRAGKAGRWHLVVAGWDQGDHEGELRRVAAHLGIGDTVHFVGPQFGAEKAATLARADAFILPSLSEGLPMAVLEAWAHGLPVLMTPQCNLPEGFAAGAAVEIAPEAERMADGLAAFLGLPAEERRAMGARGRAWMARDFAWDGIARQMAGVYRWLVEGGEPPPCVRMR